MRNPIPNPESLRWMIVAGAALRLLGLLFNGMHDVEEIVIGWGTALAHSGFSDARGAAWDYGIFSYLFHGAAAAAATAVPRFWWLPHKVLALLFEVGVLLLLLRLSGPIVRRSVVLFYWLNPAFIVHGAWLGYWDGPFTMAALLAVVLARDLAPGVRWVGVGAALAFAANLKPQGAAFFLVPAGTYLALRAMLSRDWRPVGGFVGGATATGAVAALVLVVGGAPSPNPLAYFLNATESMPNLSNGGLNIWRPVVATYQFAHGQAGPTYTAQIEPTLDLVLNAFAWVTTGVVLLAFCYRIAREARPGVQETVSDWRPLLTVLTFSALAFTQLAPRSHLGHGYAGLVLLTLWTWDRRLRGALCAMAAIQFYALIATYGVGQDRLPDANAYGDAARSLIGAVWRASDIAPGLVRIQAGVNEALAVLPYEPTLSMLAAAQWAIAMFTLVTLGRPEVWSAVRWRQDNA